MSKAMVIIRSVPVKKQLTVNVSTPRPGVTEAEDVVRLFRLINQPRENVPFGDVVGDALRLDALTIPRPGMIHSMEWREVDLDIEQRWTIPAVKMKTGWDHVVPLSRQAIAILERVQKITGNRRYVFSCADDEPLSSSNTQCPSARTRHQYQGRTLRARFSHHVLDPLPSRGAQGSQGVGWRCYRIAIGASRKFDGEGYLQAAWTAGADRPAHQIDAALGGPGRWLARSQEGGADEYPENLTL